MPDGRAKHNFSLESSFCLEMCMLEWKEKGLPDTHTPILSTGPITQDLFRFSASMKDEVNFNTAFRGQKANVVIC